MNLQRFCIKFYAQPAAAVDDAQFIDVFHTWIQRQALPGILIDVVDYRHVSRGPGVMLIGHEANLSMDRTDGRPGLLYQRKADQPGPLGKRVLTAVEAALYACKLLQDDPRFDGELSFSGNELLFIANDRLLAPGDGNAEVALQEALTGVTRRLYGSDDVRLDFGTPDPRERPRVHIHASAQRDIVTLLEDLRRRVH